jgi:hypothetical protein
MMYTMLWCCWRVLSSGVGAQHLRQIRRVYSQSHPIGTDLPVQMQAVSMCQQVQIQSRWSAISQYRRRYSRRGGRTIVPFQEHEQEQ